jgi:cytochrome c oxidase assembly protein subunit 11
MDATDLPQANRRVVKRLGLVVLAMFGFGFALVPLYDVFCEITGLNGKTGRIEIEQALGQKIDRERLVTVQFLVSVNSELPWDVRPMVKKIKVHPGEVTEVKYLATNKTAGTVAGQAVPSLMPGLAAKYFNKTECFCFTRQVLGPGEVKEMPLRFIVDPELPEDIRTVSLSYTVYQADLAVPGGGRQNGGFEELNAATGTLQDQPI